MLWDLDGTIVDSEEYWITAEVELAARFGAEFLTAKATAVDFSERPFKVWVRDELHTADAVIVRDELATIARVIASGEKSCGISR